MKLICTTCKQQLTTDTFLEHYKSHHPKIDIRPKKKEKK